MYATSGVDPAGLLARPAVGLVGPYRDADINADIDVEVEQARVTTSEEEDPSPTPGRENWRLQSEGEPVKRVMTMTELWPKDWGMYNEQQAHDADSLNESAHARARAHDTRSSASAHDSEERGTAHRRKTLMMAASTFSHRDHVGLDAPEPFSQLWVSLSSLYGQLIVVLMVAFCLTEVMDNAVKMLSLQGIFLMYLYVGSIAVIICIYGWVLVDSCASLTASRRPTPANVTTAVVGGADADAEMAEMSLSRFGSLKRAHLGRGKSTGTSFYLRIGALAFGLGTLVFNGLEVAMHSMMEGSCLNDVIFVHPVLHGLFTFLQMHFLFVNSQVLVEKFGLAARFGFMHLAATNLALWARLVVWESGNEWTYFVHLSQGGAALSIPTPLQLRGFPRSMTLSRATRSLSNTSYRVVSDAHIAQVVALHECLNTNSLGQLWTASMPFLYPFIVQFSLIAAAVTFVMGQNVGRHRLASRAHRYLTSVKQESMHRAGFTVDCGGASKGLFLGLLALVAGTVVIIIFLVVKEDLDFPADTIFWLTSGSVIVILAMALVVAVVGLAQIRRLSLTGREPSALDTLLSTATSAGVALYAVFGLVVGGAGLALSEGEGFTTSRRKHAVLLAASALQLAHAAAQATLVAEALRRACLTRQQMLSKPGRQAVTFLLCANAVLWAFDTFVTQSWLSQELQLRFYGVLAWGVVSRIGLPLLVFFRFHSCVLLLEVWKRSYRTRMPDGHSMGAGGGGGGPGVGAGN